jgi:exosome complex exonuclease DIS3/RRP44
MLPHAVVCCAQMVSTRFTKSVIASRAALTYKQAQERIDNLGMQDEVTLGESQRLVLCLCCMVQEH